MATESHDLIGLVHEQRLKDYLSSVTKQASLGIALLNGQGRPIIQEASDATSVKKLLKMIKSLTSKPGVNQLSPTKTSADISRSPDLPLYTAPLLCNNNQVGMIVIWFTQEESEATSQREFLLIRHHLQDILGYRYELDNLSSEIVRNYEELTLLYDLSVKLAAQTDNNKINEVIIEQVQSILPGSTVALLMVDRQSGEVASKAVLDGKGRALPGVHLQQGSGITGEVITSGQPSITCNVNEHKGFVKVGYSITSLMSIPMSVGDQVIGIINVSDKAKGAEFTTYDLKLVSAIASVAAVSLENARHFGEAKELYMSAVKSLVMAIDAKDPYTHSHSIRVSQLSSAVAEELELDPREVEDIRLAALLHDVGKIGIPENVLLKTGKLTDEEWETMKQHPLLSVQILEHFKPFQHISKWVRCEHERHDGKGYPDGLAGNDIPLPSRIIAAADAFDAITSDRYYRKHRSDEVAIEILQTHSGTQFDPDVIKAFVKAYHRGKLKTSPTP